MQRPHTMHACECLHMHAYHLKKPESRLARMQKGTLHTSSHISRAKGHH